MVHNVHFPVEVVSEQELYEDLVIESLQIYGQDFYYIPRDIVKVDNTFMEDPSSSFNSSYVIEMYVDNLDGFEGQGDLFTKFGIEIRDQATLTVARKRWKEAIGDVDNDINSQRPREGDLVYIPFSNKLFEITKVEHEAPFYQLNNLPTYKLQCELFEYNNEDLDTGIAEIDAIESDFAYKFALTLDNLIPAGDYTIGETVTQSLANGVTISGEVNTWDSGTGKLEIIHVGADDGDYHEFVTGSNVVGSTSATTYSVNTIVEDNQLSETEQNEFFRDDADFIDFSESNPFGEPS